MAVASGWGANFLLEGGGGICRKLPFIAMSGPPSLPPSPSLSFPPFTFRLCARAVLLPFLALFAEKVISVRLPLSLRYHFCIRCRRRKLRRAASNLRRSRIPFVLSFWDCAYTQTTRSSVQDTNTIHDICQLLGLFQAPLRLPSPPSLPSHFPPIRDS